MFYVIVITHEHVPTLFGPYCSFKSALDIAQGPACNVPYGVLQTVDETYYHNDHDTYRSVTITESTKLGCIPS